MVYYRCNHDLKFIVASSKDAKALVYYITNYITKNTIYTSHMYSLLQVAVQKIESTFTESQCTKHLERSRQLLIWFLNTIGSQQEILATRAISYLMRFPDHITNIQFSTIPWYSLLMWFS